MSNLVCFVCGSLGAAYSLHTKPRDKGSYFPFLETHDPPNGARKPTNDGVIDGCRVCYALLNQQWDSFELTKTPALKRLYWLKRTDNGTFTGAEMHTQGEYAAQMMGLQYQTESIGAYVRPPQKVSSPHSSSHSVHRSAPTAPAVADPAPARHTYSNQGALDLSFGSDRGKSDAPARSPPGKVKPEPAIPATSYFKCFLCHCQQSISQARFIFSQQYTEGEPCYAFLNRIPIPPGVRISASNSYQVCRNCKNTLASQWQKYKLEGVPESHQHYVINNVVVSGSYGNGAKTEDSGTVEDVCFLCAQSYARSNMKLLNTRPPSADSGASSKHSIYFPFVLSLKPPRSARPPDADGRVQACRACYSYLQRQWQSYQSDNTPMEFRHFMLRPLNEQRSNGGGTKTGADAAGKESEKEATVHPLNVHVNSSSSAASKAAVSLASLPYEPPAGLLAIAAPTSSHLSPSQMMLHSAYSQHAALLAAAGFLPPASSAGGGSVQGLGDRSSAVRTPGGGTDNMDAAGKRSPGKAVAVASRDQKPPAAPPRGRTGTGGSDTGDPAAGTGAAEHCFLCGARCGSKVCRLRSRPLPPTTNDADHHNLFFPFLTEVEPAPKARNPGGGGDTGSVNACRLCFYNLANQWKEYEKSNHQSDASRWHRKYNHKIFVCYTCGLLIPRSDVKVLNTKKFSTLPLTPKPRLGVQMDDDASVVVCRACREDLQRQFELCDKQGIPVPRRTYMLGSNKGSRDGLFFSDDVVSSFMSAVLKLTKQMECSSAGARSTAALLPAPASSPVGGGTAAPAARSPRVDNTRLLSAPYTQSESDSKVASWLCETARVKQEMLERDQLAGQPVSSRLTPPPSTAAAVSAAAGDLLRAATPGGIGFQPYTRSASRGGGGDPASVTSAAGSLPPYYAGALSSLAPPPGPTHHDPLLTAYSMAAATAQYHRALAESQHLAAAAAAYRFDSADPTALLLERYRLLQAAAGAPVAGLGAGYLPPSSAGYLLPPVSSAGALGYPGTAAAAAAAAPPYLSSHHLSSAALLHGYPDYGLRPPAPPPAPVRPEPATRPDPAPRAASTDREQKNHSAAAADSNSRQQQPVKVEEKHSQDKKPEQRPTYNHQTIDVPAPTYNHKIEPASAAPDVVKRPASRDETDVNKHHSKRRRLYQGSTSQSPKQADGEQKHAAVLSMPNPIKGLYANQDNDQMRSDSRFSVSKIQFLSSLGLQPLTEENRECLEHIRKVCEWDKMRRNGKEIPSALDNIILSSPIKNNVESVEKTAVTKQFVEDFHKSVLEATRNQQLQKAKLLQEASVAPPVGGSKATSAKNDDTTGFRWAAGFEVVADSYLSQLREVRLEHSVLLENCAKLKAKHQELEELAKSLCKQQNSDTSVVSDLKPARIESGNSSLDIHNSLDKLKSSVTANL